MAIVFLAFIK